MGRLSGIKWDKSVLCRPVHNIISSDFPKYHPQPWKLMEGKAKMAWLLSYEYQRIWIKEREAWKKRMYPENTTVNVDVVKRYVMSFKNNSETAKPQEKELFKMKKFQGIGGKTSNRRPTPGGDKETNFEKATAIEK